MPIQSLKNASIGVRLFYQHPERVLSPVGLNKLGNYTLELQNDDVIE